MSHPWNDSEQFLLSIKAQLHVHAKQLMKAFVVNTHYVCIAML